MHVSGISASSGSNVNLVEPDEVGFAGLSADDFLKLLIVQLQNQDPTEPVGNDELLNQLATMRNLQSNIELGEAIESITSNQQLSTAASFIGKTISGTTNHQESVTGVADRAFLRDGIAYVSIGENEVPLSHVTSVEQAA